MGNLKKRDMTDSSEEFTLEQEALIRQWIEYRKVVLDRLNPQQPVPHSVFHVSYSYMSFDYLMTF